MPGAALPMGFPTKYRLTFLSPAACYLHRFAHVAPTWELPGVWESRALNRLRSLHGAVVFAVKENAGTVLFFNESEAAAVGAQAGEPVDEFRFIDSEEGGQGGDVGFGDFDLSWPAATIAAAHALIPHLVGSVHPTYSMATAVG